MFKELLALLYVSVGLILVNMSSGHVCPSSLGWRYLLLPSSPPHWPAAFAGHSSQPLCSQEQGLTTIHLPDTPFLLWKTSPAFSVLRGSLGMQDNFPLSVSYRSCPHINYLQDQPQHTAHPWRYKEHMPRGLARASCHRQLQPLQFSLRTGDPVYPAVWSLK